jgi:hypothetical protein
VGVGWGGGEIVPVSGALICAAVKILTSAVLGNAFARHKLWFITLMCSCCAVRAHGPQSYNLKRGYIVCLVIYHIYRDIIFTDQYYFSLPVGCLIGCTVAAERPLFRHVKIKVGGDRQCCSDKVMCFCVSNCYCDMRSYHV